MIKAKLRLYSLVKSNNGFSLVEIIVAIAVLLIVVFAFTTLFTSAFGGIFTQGRKSGALYDEAQQVLEQLYEQGASVTGAETLSITFDAAPANPVNVTGSVVNQNYNYDNKTGVIDAFIPNNE